MKFSPPLIKAQLIRRYKRFLADVDIDGVAHTVHCPNTGSMKHCVVPGSPCWLSESNNSKRKTRYTWELATTSFGLACINTHRANELVAEALAAKRIPELSAFPVIQREKKYSQGSRIDFLLESGGEHCFVEVKSVTLAVGEGLGLFPDAVSTRAQKHLDDLLAMRREGHRAVLLFCVPHQGILRVAPAMDIDPTYGKKLVEVHRLGVEVLAYGCRLDESEISLDEPMAVLL